MSYENFVQLQLSAALSIEGTTVTVATPVGPNRLPPAGGGILILADSVGSPAFVEIIRYASRTGNTLEGVERALEGTSARTWPVGTYCYQALTAAAFASLLASKLDAGATAVAAAKLATARTIGGVSFDGSANINLPGVNTAGDQNTSGNAATASKLATARTINGVAFDGSANITIADPASVTKAGDTMSGNLTMADNAQVRLGTDADLRLYHNGSHSYIDQSVTGNLYIRNNVTGGTILFYADNTGGTSQLVAQLGVGTDNAAYLYAAGATKLNTTAAGVAVTGTIIASSNITAYSDERLKEKIEIIPQALNKVVQLRGVTYNRKDSGERHTGVIAQDVQKVMPEAVIQGEEYLSVAYGNLVGLLIESIKELNGKVDLLQEEVTELRRAA